MKQPVVFIQKPRAKFSLIHTGSKPKYTVRTTIASVDGGGVQSAGQALSLRDSTTSSAILPMISRGFWLLLELESRYKGLPESRLHGRSKLAIHGTGYPFPGEYDDLLWGILFCELPKVISKNEYT